MSSGSDTRKKQHVKLYRILPAYITLRQKHPFSLQANLSPPPIKKNQINTPPQAIQQGKKITVPYYTQNGGAPLPPYSVR